MAVPVYLIAQAFILAYATREAWTPTPTDIPPISHQFRVTEIAMASKGLRLGVDTTTIVRYRTVEIMPTPMPFWIGAPRFKTGSSSL